MKQNPLVTLFETTVLRDNWQHGTGKFRARIWTDDDLICWDVPGKGGKMSIRAARWLGDLWKQGFTAGEISRITGFPLAS